MSQTVTFDHYQVLQRDDGSLYELGRGAMGITYKAFDSNLRVPVALKVINGTYLDSDVARQRFVREARAAAKLRHRHVASVFHLGSEGDTMFYAMEFIDGETVDALIKHQGPLKAKLALRIVDQVARALNAALAHGLVHRDIKPANLMLVREDDELAVKVIDFGLAKGAVGSGEDAATLSLGGFVGTPHFASPEQLREGDVDGRSDIYSLGVTLWYMLAGQTPFAGSMAQVMSQHLEKPPPFEKLLHVPASVAGLLRRMLAKEAADRPQTPAELRREIEQALESLNDEPVTQAAEIDEQDNFATLTEPQPPPLPVAKTDSRFETGATVAGRYRLEESLGDTNTGRLFRAEEIAAGRLVRLLVLHPELTVNPATYTQIEREVEKVTPVEHPNLLRVYALETVDEGSFITLEWVNGFSLLEVLRARREIEAVEALRLLPQAADGVDFALAAGLKRLDLVLHQVFVHFAETIDKAAMMRRPVTDWPTFTLKLNPLGITRELSASETWAGGQTVVGGGSRAAAVTDDRVRAIQALGMVVYELLGGALPPSGSSTALGARYTPLANLSERGNQALREALGTAPPYAKAYEFCRALSELEGHPTSAPGIFSAPSPSTHASASESTQRRHATRMPTVAPIAPKPSGPPPRVPKMPPPMPPFGQPPRSALPIVVFCVLVVLIGGAAAFWFFVMPELRGKTDVPQKEDIVLELPPFVEPPVATPIPKPPPPPPPTRQEVLKLAVASAETIELKEEWPVAIQEWTKIARDFPEFEVGRVRSEILIQMLAKRTSEVNQRELALLRGPMIEAAELGVLAAMKFLGKALQTSEPATSYAWYSAAAERGDLESLTQKGLMLSNGEGVEKDLAKATDCLREAAEKGHATAIMLMGESYLIGKNVPQSLQKAAEHFQVAADKGNPIAMNKLGECFHKGYGVKQNYTEAVRWFSEAAKNGHLESYANLGALYMNGDGVEVNEFTAVEWFKKGIAAGDAACMFNYARCLELGRGATANAKLAEGWYVKAAEAGSDPAKDWCRKKKVDFKGR